MIRQMFRGKSSDEGISSFQALSLALSGRVGTGNIAGVATAIAYGGPGAVFWMWLIAFVGAGSAFVEAALAQVYKTKQDGQFRGGPAYYIEKGLKWKWYAVLFAVVTVLATGVLLPGVQANSIAEGMKNCLFYSSGDNRDRDCRFARYHHFRRCKAHRPGSGIHRAVYGHRLYFNGSHYRCGEY